MNENPREEIATAPSGEPTEVRYLREMYNEAYQDAIKAQQRCAALAFAISQHEIFCCGEDEPAPEPVDAKESAHT